MTLPRPTGQRGIPQHHLGRRLPRCRLPVLRRLPQKDYCRYQCRHLLRLIPHRPESAGGRQALFLHSQGVDWRIWMNSMRPCGLGNLLGSCCVREPTRRFHQKFCQYDCHPSFPARNQVRVQNSAYSRPPHSLLPALSVSRTLFRQRPSRISKIGTPPLIWPPSFSPCLLVGYHVDGGTRGRIPARL